MLSLHSTTTHQEKYTQIWKTGQYFCQLCKSKVVLVMLSASVVGMMLTPGHYHNLTTMIMGTLGIACAACGSAALNHLFEKDIDKKMQRTAKRPLAQDKVTPKSVLLFASALLILSSSILYCHSNIVCLTLTLATTIGYAYIYTRWLKPLTPQNIVIGGLSGAMPPLLGWTCLTGEIHAEPLLLVLIIFAWTPAHFWPLAIHNQKDYAKAKLPMLPNTHGITFTKLAILAYAWLTFATSVLPFCVGFAGTPYLIGVIGLNIPWLRLAHDLQTDSAIAMPMFKYSISYIMGLFGFLLADHYYLVFT